VGVTRCPMDGTVRKGSYTAPGEFHWGTKYLLYEEIKQKEKDVKSLTAKDCEMTLNIGKASEK